jgi:hypothetical protein
MCDDPDKSPWDVLLDPALVLAILPEVLNRVLDKGVEQLQSEIPALKDIPRERLVGFLRGIERKKAVMEGTLESDLVHMEFDIHRLKKLSERELGELLGNKLVPRIVEDIKKLEVERPIPDWCYAFF